MNKHLLSEIQCGTKIIWLGFTYIVTDQKTDRRIFCQSVTTGGGAWLLKSEKVTIKTGSIHGTTI